MATYIIKQDGAEINRILASEEFMLASDYTDYELVPEPPAQTVYVTEITSKEMLSLLTAEEFELLQDSTNAPAVKFLRRMTNRDIYIDVNGPNYDADLTMLRNQSIITPARKTELEPGMPEGFKRIT